MARPILIIEDDADISESLRYNFEREGLPAVTAGSPSRSKLYFKLSEMSASSSMIRIGRVMISCCVL